MTFHLCYGGPKWGEYMSGCEKVFFFGSYSFLKGKSLRVYLGFAYFARTEIFFVESTIDKSKS